VDHLRVVHHCLTPGPAARQSHCTSPFPVACKRRVDRRVRRQERTLLGQQHQSLGDGTQRAEPQAGPVAHPAPPFVVIPVKPGIAHQEHERFLPASQQRRSGSAASGWAFACHPGPPCARHLPGFAYRGKQQRGGDEESVTAARISLQQGARGVSRPASGPVFCSTVEIIYESSKILTGLFQPAWEASRIYL
jgi:hypothetical protein